MTVIAKAPRLLVAFTMPMRLTNALNAREHWSKRFRRAKAQRAASCMALRSAAGVSGLVGSIDWSNCHVTLTRVSPRPFDSHDGLQASFKAVVDGVSDALGVDDGRGGVRWHYRQERGAPKEHKVIVQVYG